MSGWFKGVLGRILGTHSSIDWEEIESALWQADLGSQVTNSILERLRSKGLALHSENVLQVAREEISKILPAQSPPLKKIDGTPSVILIVGVNGTGKTTATGKLAAFLKNQDYKVILCAADTFRAAAIEQLKIWGENLNVPVVSSQYGADPAALCHDAFMKAKRLQADFLICDTAGRLHTKSHLMQELGKIKRSIAKIDGSAPHETLLVVDATTGNNGLFQAREFNTASPLTGIILTKLDGSGKGGIAVSIARELSIFPRFLGTGEGFNDISEFERESFVEHMI